MAYANANGAPGSAIAIVDDGGHLLYFVRLDGTFTASPNISIGKAKSAALFKKPTADFENLINKGRFAMTALAPDFTPLQGGVPIKHGDQSWPSLCCLLQKTPPAFRLNFADRASPSSGSQGMRKS